MELSPVPQVAKKIADRSEGGSDSDSDSSIYIIENIDAIKSVTDLEEEDKKKTRRRRINRTIRVIRLVQP
jgi:hypothetical protein